MNEIAAIGPLSLDAVAGAPARPGGTVFYSARTLAHLGADATVAASCAAVDRERLLPPLEAFGLPVSWHESGATAAYRLHYVGDRRVMTQDAVGDPWTPEAARAAVGAARWVHVGALVRTDFPPETLVALAADGARLLVDAQGLVRTPLLGPLRTDGEVGSALESVSVLKLNEEEADVLAGGTEPAAIRELGVPEVLVTHGSRGALVVADGHAERVPAPALGDIDPTGAGDTFSAAYLVARVGGAEPVEAARAATETVAALYG